MAPFYRRMATSFRTGSPGVQSFDSLSQGGDLVIGRNVSHYRIVEKAGEGAMGVVYRAEDTRLGRTVALKFLAAEAAVGEEFRQRFLSEAKAAAALDHPNICTIFEVGNAEGRPFLAMSFVDGGDLRSRIGSGPLPLDAALDIAIQAAQGLRAAHQAGIVHRDVKSANLLLTSSGQVKITDFGLARIEEETRMTQTGSLVGTPAYMSPEQAEGRPTDRRTDIWSLGVVLYEMAAGRLPFAGERVAAVLHAIAHQPHEPITSLRAGVPLELDRVLSKALAKDPGERYQHLDDMLVDLQALRRGLATPGTGAAPRPEAAPKRSAWRWIAPTAAAGLLGAALLTYWIRRPPAFSPSGAVKITFDGGIAATPALSPDARLLAYSSDRSGNGTLDIWLRQIAGQSPVRLTSLPGSEYNPQFSPDGTRLYFLTGDQTLYEMPALGGPAKKLLEKAGPFAVSSKGEIAFARLGYYGRPGSVFVFRPGESAPQPWAPECRSVPRPAWSPDGEALVLAGECNRERGAFFTRRGEPPKKAFRFEPGQPATPAWFRHPALGDMIVYSLSGELQRFSAGAGSVPMPFGGDFQLWSTVGSDGRLVFSGVERESAVWELDLESNSVPPARTVNAIGHFSVARDGSSMAYSRLTARHSGELVVRNLATGEERVFAEHDSLGASLGSIWPQMSPDGSRVLYRALGAKGGHYLLNVAGGETRRVAALEQFQLASDWTEDGSRVLGECAAPRSGICQLDPGTGAVTVLAESPGSQLLYPSRSWDGKRMVFMRRPALGPAAIWMSPVERDGRASPESQWVELATAATDNSRPRFSPDGSTVYFMMGRAGHRYLVAQSLSQDRRAAAGEPKIVGENLLELSTLAGWGGPYPLISVTRRKLYFSRFSLHGNLWGVQLY